MRGRIYAIAKKELRQIARDRRSLAVLLLVPVFLLVMFGYAISLDVRHIPMAVYDGEKSPESRRLIDAFTHSEYFDLKYDLASPSEIDALMGRDEIRAALVIPPDFSSTLLRDDRCELQVVVDGSNATSASTALGYLQAIVQDYASGITLQSLARLGGAELQPPLDYRPRVWYNPELHSSVFLVPGLITFIMLISAVISTALSIVREKERGTMEQILVSPVRPLELIAGKTIPYVVISLVVSAGVLAVSYLLFGVTVRGSYLLLLLVILLFLLSCLGVGILISTLAETQHMAFTLSAIITILPSFILSGFVFPIRNMPLPIQVITYLFPARYFLVALRSVIIKGTGLASFWEQALALLVFGSTALTLSTLRMRRQAHKARSPG
jgi:ABC-2 type transport system permease protein